MDFHELKKMTVAQMRSVAKESGGVTGYTQMNKEKLLAALCEHFGIDMHEHHHVVGIDKTAVKSRIRELKAERAAALEMLGELPDGPRVTLGADRGYDTQDFVESCRLLGVTPHVAQNTTNRESRIDARTTRHPGPFRAPLVPRIVGRQRRRGRLSYNG